MRDETQAIIEHMAQHIEVRRPVLAAFLEVTDGLGMASDKDIANAWAAAFYKAGMTPTLPEFNNLGTHRVNMYEFVPALQSIFWRSSNG
ncbi:hypothetical protein HF289_08625 [Acidithiobacillus ferrooxidans]|uniref:hypothetical protein n=1 Tax=Acidithiobacillus ferrooxidans TaxID=920 RepID=UPI001C06E90C|nr:hypothetical protein [Acidithiobacillus ferrooxidans]MBU2856934.1 hypothetical protein [Acidithiobacillus ferrooxidans]